LPQTTSTGVFSSAPVDFAEGAPVTATVVATATATTATTVPSKAEAKSETHAPTLIIEEEAPEETVATFSSAALRAGATPEERMMTRTKGKINRMGFSNYEATKATIQQMMSSDNLSSLEEIMEYIFLKAAKDSIICPLYAKLIHEIADEFPHFRTVVVKLFRDYTTIFSLVATEATVDNETNQQAYKKMLEANERKKYRRGYSQFVGELAKIGEIDVEGFRDLLQTILGVLETVHTRADQDKLVCEEYIDCLTSMCKSASGLLTRSAWSAPLRSRIQAMVAKPRTELVGFSVKARFALMNLSDYAENGWK